MQPAFTMASPVRADSTSVRNRSTDRVANEEAQPGRGVPAAWNRTSLSSEFARLPGHGNLPEAGNVEMHYHTFMSSATATGRSLCNIALPG